MSDKAKEIKPKEAREFLKRQIKDWENGWTNLIGSDKGRVTDPGARYAIRCLRWCLANLPDALKRRRRQ